MQFYWFPVMLKRNAQLPVLWLKTRGAFVRLATGGDWALTQTAATRRNLIWFWFDGFFASASDNIIGTYMVVYLLSLGATQAHIGLMSSLSSFSAALLLLPGAMLVERLGRRRNICLIGGGWNRIALLFIALAPFFLPGGLLIPAAIALSISRDATGNLAFPAWMSLTGDIVPIEGRGRFFSSRNIIMGLSGMLVTFIAGLVITRYVQPLGYQLVLLAAFAIGLLSIFSFAHLSDQPSPLPYPRVKNPLRVSAANLLHDSAANLLHDLTGNREFLYFVATSALWNFSLNIAGPFFTVHLVNNLHADATMIALTTISSTLASILAQRKSGDLNDRWGARRLTVVCGLLIPVVPLMWVFATAAWHVILINLVSGMLWAGYSLASFNYLLIVTPDDRRARFSALFQIVVMVSLAVGAALGSLIVTRWGYFTVFSASAAGRMLAALLFVWLLSRKKPTPKVAVAAE